MTLPADALITGAARFEPHVVEHPEDGLLAGLLCRFPTADGEGWHPPVLIVNEDLTRLMQAGKKAAETAEQTVRNARRRGPV